jgi:endonuclease/exonuclease/phosphatase (EEP) superfamily protein YafD
MAESRRERRLAEARQAAEQAGSPVEAGSPLPSPSTSPSPYAGYGPTAQPLPPTQPPHRGGPPPRLFVPGGEADGERLRGEGRRISETSELHGLRRVLHVASLPAFGVLLLAWAATTLVGDVPWGPFSVLPVAFACLSPLTVVAAVPLVLVAIQRRRWAAMVPAVVAAALPWCFVVSYALPADPLAGPTLPLRAMIVTAHDGEANAADIAAAVRSQRTDLLVVTELSAALAHDLAAAGLPDGLLARYVRVPDPGASPASGIGVYSRFPVDEKAVTQLRGTHWPAVVVPVPVGPTTVTLVAGHAVQPSTDHLDRWRRDLAAFRGAERIKGPVLVLVNLNATTWNPQYRSVVSGRLHDAADVLGRGLRPTWPNWTPVPLLATDHALVAGLGVTELSALSVTGSDHRALSVGLQVPSGPSRP